MSKTIGYARYKRGQKKKQIKKQRKRLSHYRRVRKMRTVYK